MTRKAAFSIVVVFSLLVGAWPAFSQNAGELAATLEVLAPAWGARVNTVNWIAVNAEAIVGVGDLIRPDASGQARITFFSDGVATSFSRTRVPDRALREERLPVRYSASLLVGQIINRVERLLDTQSSYDIQTPGMELTVRGTEFLVRVEASGRSAALVRSGITAASNAAQAPRSRPVRNPRGAGRAAGDVVAATNFESLDAALDGCAAQVQTADDVRLNVRLGPAREYPRVGTLDGAEIDLFMGVSASAVVSRGLPGGLRLGAGQPRDDRPGLRRPARVPDTPVEDPALYRALGEEIRLEDLVVPAPPARPRLPTATVNASVRTEPSTVAARLGGRLRHRGRRPVCLVEQRVRPPAARNDGYLLHPRRGFRFDRIVAIDDASLSRYGRSPPSGRALSMRRWSTRWPRRGAGGGL